MADLTAELSIMVPGHGLCSATDVSLNPALLEDADDMSDPDGALSITADTDYIFLEDVYYGLSDFMLRILPAALQSGEGAVYDFRSSPETLTVAVSGDSVSLSHDGGQTIEMTTDELLGLIEELKLDYNGLERRLAG